MFWGEKNRAILSWGNSSWYHTSGTNLITSDSAVKTLRKTSNILIVPLSEQYMAAKGARSHLVMKQTHYCCKAGILYLISNTVFSNPLLKPHMLVSLGSCWSTCCLYLRVGLLCFTWSQQISLLRASSSSAMLKGLVTRALAVIVLGSTPLHGFISTSLSDSVF